MSIIYTSRKLAEKRIDELMSFGYTNWDIKRVGFKQYKIIDTQYQKSLYYPKINIEKEKEYIIIKHCSIWPVLIDWTIIAILFYTLITR